MTDHMRFKATLEGGDELVYDLLQMGANTNKSIRGATKAGAKVVRDEAEANARAITAGHTGKTRHVALKTRLRKGAPTDYAVASIYPAKGFAELRPIESGTKAGVRWARRKGPFKFMMGGKLIVTRIIQHPGTTPQPWLSSAFDAKREEAVQAMQDSLIAAVEEARVAADEGDIE